MGSILPTANKYLFANPFLFMSGEGDEATSSSFAIFCVAIQASNVSLEALIASLLAASGTTEEAIFLTVIKLLIAVGLLCACANGEWKMPLSCALIGSYNVLL